MKESFTFPDDFIKTPHSVIPGAVQWLATIPSDDGIHQISVVGGGFGLYGDGISTFEMWDIDHADEPQGYLTKEQINEYLSIL